MIDEIAFIIFICCFLISIIFMYVSLKRPYSRKGRRRQILKKWVEININKPSAAAIQAIRNQILVNSALISALLVLAGILIGLGNQIFTNSEEFLWGLIGNLSVSLMQLILILFCIFFSLINFVNSNRMASNLSYLITSNPADSDSYEPENLVLVQDVFRISQRSWMLGIRGVFYIIAAFTWIITSVVFIISTLLLTIYLILMHDFTIFDRNTQ